MIGVVPVWLLAAIFGTALHAHVNTQTDFEIVGDYLCTIVEKARIASLHFEDADPPSARLDNGLPTRFKIRITREAADRFRMVEIPYEGPDRDLTDYSTRNSTLHDDYVGDGVDFRSSSDLAFVRFHRTMHDNADGDHSFYHAGFEYPGGEDTDLSVRWGRCALIE